MISNGERRARLWARHHLGCRVDTVLAATRDVVAVHSSDPLTPHFAMWARVTDYQPVQLDRLLDGGVLWRMHSIRRTIWIVDAKEAPIFDGAAARKIAKKERERVVGWVAAQREDAEGWLASLERTALEAIEQSPGVLTRSLTSNLPELSTKVLMGSGKWAQEAAIGSRLLFVLAMEGKIRRTTPTGSWKSSQYGWAVAPDGFGEGPDEASCRAELLRRYLSRFGPATFNDAKWWTGWTVAQTKKALAANEAVEVEVEGGTGWVLPGDDDESEPAKGVALLPALDPTAMGWKDRAWYLGKHEGPLFDRNGNIGPTIWVDGRIIGGWATRSDGTVITRLLEACNEAAVDAEAARLTKWLHGTDVTPRFRTPLEKELTA